MTPARRTSLLSASGLVLATVWLIHECRHAQLPPIDGWVVGATAVYVLAHLLRGMRLFLLLYDGRVQVRGVIGTHLATAAVSHAIPFKLGEVYRVLMVGGLLRHLSRALMAVWTERIFDMCAVLAIAGTMTAIGGDPVSGLGLLLPLGAAFLFVSGFVFLVLPESLHLMIRYTITRHNSRRSLRLLELAERLMAIVAKAGRVLRTRWASVTWLTLAIWGLELTALSLVLTAQPPGTTAGGLIGVFHALGLQLDTWTPDTVDPVSQAVRVITIDAFVALIVIGWCVHLALRALGAYHARRSVAADASLPLSRRTSP